MNNRVFDEIEKISKTALDEAKKETMAKFNKSCNVAISISGVIFAISVVMLFVLCSFNH